MNYFDMSSDWNALTNFFLLFLTGYCVIYYYLYCHVSLQVLFSLVRLSRAQVYQREHVTSTIACEGVNGI